MNNDNGYLKAQRDYDNQMPPEQPDPVECPDCEGTGKVEFSNCCGASLYENTDICAKCKEHCEKDKCERCDGEGNLNAEKEQQAAYEEYCERKADEARDERDNLKIGSDIDKFLDKHGGD